MHKSTISSGEPWDAFAVEGARHEEGTGEFRGGDKGADIQKVSGERKREKEREGEVTVPRADFHELRNRRRTARPWHRLPLIFYCPCLRRRCCCVRHDVSTHRR